jgi:MFS family permease
MPKLPRQIWLLAWGRLLSEIGSGFTLFYAPIFFVQQVGLSATAVGVALGTASISGIAGRIISGIGVDRWGRKPILVLAIIVSAIACGMFARTQNFSTLLVSCSIQGLGVGLYWPANEAIVADLTTGEERRLAYAFTRLADNLGLGLGIIAGGILISQGGAYRTLFVVDGISFLLFAIAVVWGIRETLDRQPSARKSFVTGYGIALGDRRLLVYILVNIIFTTYIAQTQSTVPLYFSNFVSIEGKSGFPPRIISVLFTWHLLVTIAAQIPILKLLKSLTHPRSLIVSGGFWAVGFACMTVVGLVSSDQILWAALGLALFALAIASYTPTASSLIADISPPSLRGVYASINSLCWAVGYAIGPPLGGWALDLSPQFAHSFWLGLAATVGIVVTILLWLDRILSEIA